MGAQAAWANKKYTGIECYHLRLFLKPRMPSVVSRATCINLTYTFNGTREVHGVFDDSKMKIMRYLQSLWINRKGD